MNPRMILIWAAVAVLVYLFMFPGSLTSESSAFTQCTKVSGTEASCNFYNRGTGEGGGPAVIMPRFNEWAGTNSISYSKCKVTSVSVGSSSGCSCGPGSGSYGCSCCTPKATTLNQVYDATGDSCPIEFDKWYSSPSGPADCYNNGGNMASFSGTVIFFSETPRCGSQITCGEWSACTSWYEKSRTCKDECNIQTTEKAYCEAPVTPITPIIPIQPPVIQPPVIIQPPDIQPTIQPVVRNLFTDISDFFKWLVALIAIPFLPP